MEDTGTGPCPSARAGLPGGARAPPAAPGPCWPRPQRLPRLPSRSRLLLCLPTCPGLTQIPQIQKTEISFRPQDPKSYDAYVTNIVRFLEKYKESAQKNDMIFEDCGSE